MVSQADSLWSAWGHRALHSDLAFVIIQDDGRSVGSTPMHIALIIAILALLAFALLPVLEHFNTSETDATGLRAYMIRIAHWAKE